MLKLGGVASEESTDRLRILGRQHLRHAPAQILLEVGRVPADGGGCAGQGEVVLAKDGREPRSLRIAGHVVARAQDAALDGTPTLQRMTLQGTQSAVPCASELQARGGRALRRSQRRTTGRGVEAGVENR